MILSYKLCMTIYVVLYHVPSHVIDHVTGQVFLLLQRLDLAQPTTVILALIQQVKATLRDGIYTYKGFGAEEVVDLNTVQCVIGRVKDRGVWSIDRKSVV